MAHVHQGGGDDEHEQALLLKTTWHMESPPPAGSPNQTLETVVRGERQNLTKDSSACCHMLRKGLEVV